MSHNPFDLSVNDQFSLDLMRRSIEACTSIEELKSLAFKLSETLVSQKTAIEWMVLNPIGKQNLNYNELLKSDN